MGSGYASFVTKFEPVPLSRLTLIASPGQPLRSAQMYSRPRNLPPGNHSSMSSGRRGSRAAFSPSTVRGMVIEGDILVLDGQQLFGSTSLIFQFRLIYGLEILIALKLFL